MLGDDMMSGNITLQEAYSTLYREDKETWKYPFMHDVCLLCLEYIMLDGLSDAMRAADIPDEILEICEVKGGDNT